MNIFPKEKSRALSAAALGTAAVCAFMSAQAVRDLFTFMDVFSTPAFFLALAQAKQPVEIPPLAALLTRHIRSVFVFALFFWLSGLALAAGVLRRREWARRGAVAMLYLLSAAALLLLLFPWLVVPRPLFYNGISLAPDFNDAVRVAAFFARTASLLAGGLFIWWALALDRGPLRKEF
jgi:hypothetical protein